MGLDLGIFESGSGGELSFIDGDFVLSNGVYQSIYLSLFGGNVEASTRGNELPGEERFDYWGNSLLFSDQPTRQQNSATERILNNTPLTSSARIAIERAVIQDLDSLNNIVNLEVNVVILSENKLSINIGINPINSEIEGNISFIFDGLINDVLIQKII